MSGQSAPWVVYYLETDDEELEFFYDNEASARKDAISVTKIGGLDPNRSATISRVVLKGPSAMKTLAGALALLKRDGYAKSAEVIATYTDGKEDSE